MHLQPIDRTDLARAWAVAEPWLAQACARPGCDLTVADLHAALERDEAALILIVDGGRPVAAGVTQVRDHRSGQRACWILALGGSGGARALASTIHEIEAGAARVGCAQVEFIGRPAWGRLHSSYVATRCSAGTHFSKTLRH
ncbi:hypothetical protein FV232_00850 [Methylobacterium sp. WL30]|uniref:hypothetical protein n=1 Tax=unclassified Methylobacterium TaxID=2615210 RepID=UPI0011CBD580|nr:MULTISPECIES: hypothetical protein [unclassified Methylobacterium]TXN32542.1 hypothetical protein FV225_19660 [Methylobacterium sp. WL93]TXN52284.1 hypothetical protein FV227_04320 [Methylobacterium sp. WL119]TXN70633.1 hypothetical protein FV232_00850 [Methylobacterium sp. WL30]